MNDVNSGSAEDFGDLKKKQLVEIQTWARLNDFVRYRRRALVWWVSFGLRRGKLIFGPRWGKTNWGLRNVPHVVGRDGKASIERNCVSLFSRRKILNPERYKKNFVPEPKESRQVFRVFSDSYALWTFVNLFRIGMNMYISCIHILVDLVDTFYITLEVQYLLTGDTRLPRSAGNLNSARASEGGYQE